MEQRAVSRMSLWRQGVRQLDKCWRVFATGLCFSIFGAGALGLTFVAIPLIGLQSKQEREREKAVQHAIQRAFNWFCQMMRFSGAIDYKIVGAETLRSDRACLIVANHPSLIDYVLIGSCLPHCDCLVKAAIWHNPFMKGVVKAAGYIPNTDPESLLENCSHRLNDGNVLLVFPEGTRTTPGVEPTLQRGAAQIAVRTGMDVRVVHITVSPDFLTKQKKWYQVPDTKPFFLVEVKDKIDINGFIANSDSLSAAARQLNQHLADVIFPAKEH
ncbi:acyl-phosphate glycerol 3-phosphate acyltransferase [Photobacterium aquae]|uniref:Acyl-phosphate glycerol 3-phosphate acyltransferase n=2 Tax=Photobacterium aquae TaxID=1195763 RepID=A0A0J1JPB5_9GAMM|nr:acyl-phosphate glycerol 3-phosphate acyltransferase [Photobacterium aquae]